MGGKRGIMAKIALLVIAVLIGAFSPQGGPEAALLAEPKEGWAVSDSVRKTDDFWITSGALISAQVNAVKLTAVGDLMVHGRQADDALVKGGGVYDYNYAFSYVRKYFQGADVVIGNLETVLAGPVVGYNDYPNFSVTDEYAYAIKNAGFTVLTTANNHSLDKGETGLLRTIETLDSLGFVHMGTYTSPEEREKITLIRENGISFAILSYTYGTNGIPIPGGRTYLVNILDLGVIKADIARAKLLEPDFIIILPHMGNEYESYTRQEFKNTIMAMLEAGADIVLASHPHVVQPAEFITVTDEDGTARECFVAYSMGNFISGQRTKPREAGVIFNLYFEKPQGAGEKAVLKDVSYIPTWVKFYEHSAALDVAVLPVYDTLTAYYWGEETGLSQSDIERVQAVQLETTKTISGVSVPLSQLEQEYFIKR